MIVISLIGSRRRFWRSMAKVTPNTTTATTLSITIGKRRVDLKRESAGGQITKAL